jgi:hypothetical protein
VQIENPSDEELQLGIDASINEDAFDLDDLSEEERGDVLDETAADLVSEASFHSAVLEVRKLKRLVLILHFIIVPCKCFPVLGNNYMRLTHKVPGLHIFRQKFVAKLFVLAAESGKRREKKEGRLGAATAPRALGQIRTVLGGRDCRRRP